MKKGIQKFEISRRRTHTDFTFLVLKVQEAVAKCLPALVPAIKQDAPDTVKKLLVILLESENYGERKGFYFCFMLRKFLFSATE